MVLNSPFIKTLYIDFPPLWLWSSLSVLSEMLPPGCSPHFAPNKTLTRNYIFFSRYNPLQYSCLENPHGQRSLVGYSPWDCKELDMTERPSAAQHVYHVEQIFLPHFPPNILSYYWFFTFFYYFYKIPLFCTENCCKIFIASGSFPLDQFFPSGASASASVLSVNVQD